MNIGRRRECFVLLCITFCIVEVIFKKKKKIKDRNVDWERKHQGVKEMRKKNGHYLNEHTDEIKKL